MNVYRSPSAFAFLIFEAHPPEGLDYFLLFALIGEEVAKTFEVVLLDPAILLLGIGTAGAGTMECSITIIIISYCIYL